MQGAQNGSGINGFKRGPLTDSKDSICSRTDTKKIQAEVNRQIDINTLWLPSDSDARKRVT
jgi:hypothetical protein